MVRGEQEVKTTDLGHFLINMSVDGGKQNPSPPIMQIQGRKACLTSLPFLLQENTLYRDMDWNV